jgi:hypothetical protein
MRALVLLLMVGFSLCCSGGGGQSESDGGAKYRIELVYPTELDPKGVAKSLVKPADLSGIPFRIGSDQEQGLMENDSGGVTDPVQATQIRGRFFNEFGEVVVEKIKTLERRIKERPSGNAIVLAEGARSITFNGVPEGVPLDLLIELGRDIGEVDAPFGEAIFYSGNLSEVVINDGLARLAGVEVDTLPVELRTVIGEESYGIQFYVDYSNMPIVSVLKESEATPSRTLTVYPFDVAAPQAEISPIEKISEDVFDFQALFFEALGIPRGQTNFDVTVDSGANLNFLSSGIVTEAEALLGVPLLIDFQTTFQQVLARWHEHEIVGYDGGALGGSKGSGNLVGAYLQLEEAFKRVEPLLMNTPSADLESHSAVDGTGTTEYYPIQAHDLGLLQWAYYIAQMCNNATEAENSVHKFRFNKIEKFVEEVIEREVEQNVSQTFAKSFNEFLFSGGRSFSVKINFDHEHDPSIEKSPLYIDSAIDDSIYVDLQGLVTEDHGLAGSGNLDEVFRDRVADRYFSSNVIWGYLYEITDLGTLQPFE